MSEQSSEPRKPSRRQIVFNWLMGEDDLTKPDGWWGGTDEVADVDELLNALDAAALAVARPVIEAEARKGYHSEAEIREAIQEEYAHTDGHGSDYFWRHVLARLNAPKEERVTVRRSDVDEPHQVSVWLDGQEECCNMIPRHAEIYATGLRAELAREGIQ